MSLSFVVTNPRVKFVIKHYRKTYSGSDYPILLHDFGWLFCNFSRFLWKASFVFPTLSTWFISLLSILWRNRITKPFCPWKFCPCALLKYPFNMIIMSFLTLFLWCLLTFFYVSISCWHAQFILQCCDCHAHDTSYLMLNLLFVSCKPLGLCNG